MVDWWTVSAVFRKVSWAFVVTCFARFGKYLACFCGEYLLIFVVLRGGLCATCVGICGVHICSF